MFEAQEDYRKHLYMGTGLYLSALRMTLASFHTVPAGAPWTRVKARCIQSSRFQRALTWYLCGFCRLALITKHGITFIHSFMYMTALPVISQDPLMCLKPCVLHAACCSAVRLAL